MPSNAPKLQVWQSITNYHPSPKHPQSYKGNALLQRKRLFKIEIVFLVSFDSNFVTHFWCQPGRSHQKLFNVAPVILKGSRNSARTLRNCIYVRDDGMFGTWPGWFHGRYLHGHSRRIQVMSKLQQTALRLCRTTLHDTTNQLNTHFWMYNRWSQMHRNWAPKTNIYIFIFHIFIL